MSNPAVPQLALNAHTVDQVEKANKEALLEFNTKHKELTDYVAAINSVNLDFKSNLKEITTRLEKLEELQDEIAFSEVQIKNRKNLEKLEKRIRTQTP
jgi:peptidoglycan hydrolase CwlO-like protein